MHLLDNSIAAMFASFIVGMMVNGFLRRLSVYERISNRTLFSKSESYERLGVLWFRKFLLATPLRYFNTSIRFSANRSTDTLESIRMHMVNAEMSHWIGFATMLILMIAAWWYRGLTIALSYLVFNMLGNLYPCLLQQYNRQRLTRVMTATKRRNAGRA